MIYERTDYFAHNNLKSRSRSHRTERDVGSKREGIINVVEDLASPYILTLILSFVLSDYSSKIRDYKLKIYIKNRRISGEFEAFGSYKTLCLTLSFVLRNRLLFIY